jgi:hypothetical protein
MSTTLVSPSVPVHSVAIAALPQLPPRRTGLVNIFVRIINDRSSKIYSLRRIASGFRLTSASDDEHVVYRVTCEHGFRYCDCPDFSKRFGTPQEGPCKHILALVALAEQGVIDFGDDSLADDAVDAPF